MQNYVQGALRKKQLERKVIKALKASFFSFLLLNLIENGSGDFLYAILAYVHSAQRKKQLIASFVEHFKGKSWKH